MSGFLFFVYFLVHTTCGCWYALSHGGKSRLLPSLRGEAQIWRRRPHPRFYVRLQHNPIGGEFKSAAVYPFSNSLLTVEYGLSMQWRVLQRFLGNVPVDNFSLQIAVISILTKVSYRIGDIGALFLGVTFVNF